MNALDRNNIVGECLQNALKAPEKPYSMRAPLMLETAHIWKYAAHIGHRINKLPTWIINQRANKIGKNILQQLHTREYYYKITAHVHTGYLLLWDGLTILLCSHIVSGNGKLVRLEMHGDGMNMVKHTHPGLENPESWRTGRTSSSSRDSQPASNYQPPTHSLNHGRKVYKMCVANAMVAGRGYLKYS